MTDETKTAEVVEVPKKFKDLVSTIESMSVLDLSELVKVIEQKFGVSAQAPVAMIAAGGAGAGAGAEPAAEKTAFTVKLKAAGGERKRTRPNSSHKSIFH